MIIPSEPTPYLECMVGMWFFWQTYVAIIVATIVMQIVTDIHHGKDLEPKVGLAIFSKEFCIIVFTAMFIMWLMFWIFCLDTKFYKEQGLDAQPNKWRQMCINNLKEK